MNRPYPKFDDWLADKNTVAGMSRIDPLPAMKAKLKPPFRTRHETTDRFQIGPGSKSAFLRQFAASLSCRTPVTAPADGLLSE
jgi:hypothetical protein